MTIDLERENADLMQFLYACPVGLIDIAHDGTIGMMNPMAMQLLLPLASTMSIVNFFDIMESCAPELRNMTDGFSASSGDVCENHRIIVSPGLKHEESEAKTMACTMVKLSPERLIVTFSDISRQVAQERRLKQAETWFASLLGDVNDFAVVSLGAEGLIDKVNPSALRQTGFSEAELLGRSLDVFSVQAQSPWILTPAEQIAKAGQDGWQLTEGWQRRKEEEAYWCQRLITVRSESKPDEAEGRAISGYTVVMREVTRQHFDASKLKQMLTTDYLTGVCNRSHFYEVGEREYLRTMRYSQPLSLIVIDVDHFKLVNDTQGHAGGDEVLKAVAQICAGLRRSSDTVARLGGEEFVVLLPSTDLAGAGEMAERLRAGLEAAEIRVNGNVLRVTASMGCAALDSEVTDLQTLLEAADKALYTAKQTGRNRVVLSVPEESIVSTP